MPRGQWKLVRGRPVLPILLVLAQGQRVTRNLLADTGAGAMRVGFELVLEESDCFSSGGIPAQSVVLGGAYSGSFPVYVVRVRSRSSLSATMFEPWLFQQHRPDLAVLPVFAF